MKQDLYLTKTESSSGYLTLFHQKITYKNEYTEYIIRVLNDTELDQSNTIVSKWKERVRESKESINGQVPKFNLETNLRKWDNIHTEVIWINCSTNDASYLKLLLASASLQGKLNKRMFIPTGLQLLEGKEVVKQILQEQQEFLESHTSFQIEDIQLAEMDANIGNTEKTIRTLY